MASLFVSCAPGLEPLLIEELTELGITGLTAGYRGVYVDNASWANIYRINYSSRIASRVLLPITQFRCFDRDSLYRGASGVDWSAYIRGNNSFAIDANVNHPQLRNSLFAAQVVKDAICDQMRKTTGDRPTVEVQAPDVQLNLYIQSNKATLSFDTSGWPLHKRGYRQESVEAPVQESLAAAILRLAKYAGEGILLDPFCGSGTFLVEAALIASNTPPGFLRKQWGFQHHPEHVQNEWLKIRNQIDEKRKTLPAGLLYGMEINKTAVWASKVNLRAAGFHQQVEVRQADFRFDAPTVPPQLIVTNPPHGRRLEEVSQLKPLYRALGDFLKKSCAKPSRAFVLIGDLELTKEIGLAAKRRHVLNNGGIDSRLLEFDIY